MTLQKLALSVHVVINCCRELPEASNRQIGVHIWTTNLIPRICRLCGQCEDARKNSGVVDLEVKEMWDEKGGGAQGYCRAVIALCRC